MGGGSAGGSAMGGGSAGGSATGGGGAFDAGTPIASLTNIVSLMAPGSWKELTGTNHFSDVALTGAENVVTAWGGGAYGAGKLWFWGGGHVDYGGNEVYTYDLATLTWSRLNQPSAYLSGCMGSMPACVTADGSPTSRHSYDGVAFLPTVGRLFAGGLYPYFDGGNTAGDDPRAFTAGIFDPFAMSWMAPGNGLLSGVGLTAYDARDGVLLVSDNNYLAAYDPIANVYKKLSGSNWAFSEAAMAWDPDDVLVVAVAASEGLATGVVFTWNLSSANFSDGSSFPGNQRVTSTRADAGSTPFFPSTPSNPGFDYDTHARLFVAWGGGGSVWTLDPQTLAWAEIIGSGSTPGNQSPNGIYGRWWYAPEYDVFIGFNDVSGNVWLFKMP
jgi:hypothetical protein